MFKSLIALAVVGAMSAPVVAQTAPSPPAAKPQTVKKVVCQRVDDEETTGSRLSSAPKVCKTVEVPAPAGGTSNGQQAPAAPSQTGNNL